MSDLSCRSAADLFDRLELVSEHPEAYALITEIRARLTAHVLGAQGLLEQTRTVAVENERIGLELNEARAELHRLRDRQALVEEFLDA